MITSSDFEKLTYSKPNLLDIRPKLSNILGIDSEAYVTGEPFMFCVSNGDILLPRDIPEIFFKNYLNVNFMIYNIKYDSGALLYHLPRPVLHELWDQGKARHEGYFYNYIPHKLLRISQGRDSVSFWDISQFYKMSLDKAARIYLKKKKNDIRTKKFSRKYVEHFFNYISKYCIMDAILTKELGEYFVDKLDEFGITVTSLYSCASISFKYFCDSTNVVTSWPFWNNCQEVLKYACDAYEGGKFEITTRGKFTGHEYDITSAYPYEISNLVDISTAEIQRSNHYQPDSIYGFIRVYIDNSAGRHIPCGIMTNNVRIYPAGKFYLTITKEEYEYLKEIGVHVDIVSGVWLFVKRKRYPYRGVIDSLFTIKDRYKGKDAMLYYVSKIVMNSFYGKCVQCIEQPDNTYKAGSGWNPIYGAVITANTRIKVTRIQNLLENDCLAVHTDSVITKAKLPPDMVHSRIGEFDHVISGDGVLIACGMYQIEDQCAFKGFKPKKISDNEHDNWISILSRFPNRKKIPYTQLHVESWIEAMAKNHPKDRINVFVNDRKMIDLNCDTKRIWIEKTTAKKLLENQEESMHKFHVEINQPKYWSNFS